ncbi:hypothetical protein C9424_19820 [Arthrobacter sp. H-02-3]|nr:hypothetical protein C9424_19820 [Arthrobacter sp. H-02-3]
MGVVMECDGHCDAGGDVYVFPPIVTTAPAPGGGAWRYVLGTHLGSLYAVVTPWRNEKVTVPLPPVVPGVMTPAMPTPALAFAALSPVTRLVPRRAAPSAADAHFLMCADLYDKSPPYWSMRNS